MNMQRSSFKRLSRCVLCCPVDCHHWDGGNDGYVVQTPHDLYEPRCLVLSVVLRVGHLVVRAGKSCLQVPLEEVRHDGVDHGHTCPEEVVEGEDYVGPLGDEDEVVGSEGRRHRMHNQPGHEVESQTHAVCHKQDLRQPLQEREREGRKGE